MQHTNISTSSQEQNSPPANKPPRPVALPVDIGKIPGELKDLPQWVIWQYEYKPKGSKPWTKVPKNAKENRPSGGLRNASSTDQATWSNFDIASSRYLQSVSHFTTPYDGIGFVLTEQDPYAGIDLDHCRDADTG